MTAALFGRIGLLLGRLQGDNADSDDQTDTVAEAFEGVGGCDLEGEGICRWVYDRTKSEGLADATEFFSNNVVQILVILAVAFVMLFVLKRAIYRGMDRVAQSAVKIKNQQAEDDDVPERIRTELEQENLRVHQRTETLAHVIYAMTRFGVWTIAVILVLGEIGINLAPLVAGAGILGVALGFGAQKVVGDFLSGIFMISEDQFGVGDVIDLGEASGTVERITLRTTVVRDIYGTLWHVPNGAIERVGNKSQNWSKALLDVGVADGTDTDLASGVLLDTAHELAHDPEWEDSFLDEPEVLGVEDLAADAVTIRISVRTRPARQFDVQRELNRRFKLALDEAGIEIPFPQRTVWVRNDGGEADT